jgi:hypothetical protein
MLKVTAIALTTALSMGAAQDGEEESVEAELALEVNLADDEAELILEIEAEDLALDHFFLLNPSGKIILGLTNVDRQDLGLSEVLIETGDSSVQAVLKAYPEGEYTALARSTDSEWFVIVIDFSHELPDEPAILSSTSVPVNGAVVMWAPDSEVDEWILEIENDELDRFLLVELPGSVTQFAIPDGFLVSGEEFGLELMAEGSDSDNLSAVEVDLSVQ